MRVHRGLTLLALLAAAGPAGAQPASFTATVERVVDGDTVRVVARGFQTTVRLVGIDTPETRRPGTPVQCWGPEATRRAERLLPEGARVRVTADPTQDRRDRYGRFLGYVTRVGMRVTVNYALVAAGDAKVYVYDRDRPFARVRSFRTAERRARAANLGLWGPPCNGRTDRPEPE